MVNTAKRLFYCLSLRLPGDAFIMDVFTTIYSPQRTRRTQRLLLFSLRRPGDFLLCEQIGPLILSLRSPCRRGF